VKVFRCPDNPIIEPKDVKPSRDDFGVIGVFNAGVARFADEIILLLRVAERPISEHPDIVLTAVYDVVSKSIVIKEFFKSDSGIDFSDPRLIVTGEGTYLTSISHLRLARSTDGIDFKIEDKPAFLAANEYEAFGVEDARISFIDSVYYVSYVSVSPLGITSSLASTVDFCNFKRHGVIFCPDNKDVVLFDGKVDGKYYALHRPQSILFNTKDIWLGESIDGLCWGNHRCLMGPRQGMWDSVKIGAGTTPFLTEFGWLEIYHGADENNRYCLGAVLTDADRPWEVLARSEKPIFEPQEDYECKGFFGNVVFSCGLLCEDGKLKIYYGAADAYVCYGELVLEEVIESLKI